MSCWRRAEEDGSRKDRITLYLSNPESSRRVPLTSPLEESKSAGKRRSRSRSLKRERRHHSPSYSSQSSSRSYSRSRSRSCSRHSQRSTTPIRRHGSDMKSERRSRRYSRDNFSKNSDDITVLSDKRSRGEDLRQKHISIENLKSIPGKRANNAKPSHPIENNQYYKTNSTVHHKTVCIDLNEERPDCAIKSRDNATVQSSNTTDVTAGNIQDKVDRSSPIVYVKMEETEETLNHLTAHQMTEYYKERTKPSTSTVSENDARATINTNGRRSNPKLTGTYINDQTPIISNTTNKKKSEVLHRQTNPSHLVGANPRTSTKVITRQTAAILKFPDVYAKFRIITVCSLKRCNFAIFHECYRSYGDYHTRVQNNRDNENCVYEKRCRFVEPRGNYKCEYCEFVVVHNACWRDIPGKTRQYMRYKHYATETCDQCKLEWTRSIVKLEYKQIWNKSLKDKEFDYLKEIVCWYNQETRKCDCGCIEIDHLCNNRATLQIDEGLE